MTKFIILPLSFPRVDTFLASTRRTRNTNIKTQHCSEALIREMNPGRKWALLLKIAGNLYVLKLYIYSLHSLCVCFVFFIHLFAYQSTYYFIYSFNCFLHSFIYFSPCRPLYLPAYSLIYSLFVLFTINLHVQFKFHLNLVRIYYVFY